MRAEWRNYAPKPNKSMSQSPDEESLPRRRSFASPFFSQCLEVDESPLIIVAVDDGRGFLEDESWYHPGYKC